MRFLPLIKGKKKYIIQVVEFLHKGNMRRKSKSSLENSHNQKKQTHTKYTITLFFLILKIFLLCQIKT